MGGLGTLFIKGSIPSIGEWSTRKGGECYGEKEKTKKSAPQMEAFCSKEKETHNL